MTREELDSETFDGTIADGDSETLELETSRAKDVIILIDNGSTDGTPETYTLTQRVYTAPIDDYQFYDSVSDETSRSWVDAAWGQRMQFEFENVSGNEATYRITIKVYRDME